MYSINSIRHVHLEISTLCNASCSWCPRNFWGYPYNAGYPETNLTILQAQQIFQPNFLKQLSAITINGNFGDIIMNPDGPKIIEYFAATNPNLKIDISTNGSARSAKFWKKIADTGAIVFFALDGLEDTHHLYRQNTCWKTVIKNAKLFMSFGGKAVWKMIKFNHNAHQVEQCRELSQSLGFSDFCLLDSSRTVGPVFNKKGVLTHCLGGYQGEKDFKVLFLNKTNDKILLEDIVQFREPMDITCAAKKQQSVYIAANGEVYPCCWLGLYPQTYGHGQYHQAANAQFKDLIKNNNALEHSLEECIQWFKEIEKTWKISTFEAGRLVICNDNCGKR